jgi:hypothetical protein
MVGGDSANNSMSKMGRKDRPKGLTIVAILQMIVGLLAFGAYLYINYVRWHATVYLDGGVAVLEAFTDWGLTIAGTVSLVLGYGIWKGRKWAWGSIMILDVLGMIFAVLVPYAFTLSYRIPIIVVCCIELWYFSRKRTRDYFD